MSEARRATPARWVLPALLAVALAALGISAMLTSYHLSQGKSPWSLFRLACGAGGGCEEVLASPWAVLPGGIPLAGLGLVYFSALFLWYAVVGPANRGGRKWQALPLLLNALGVLASIYLIVVMLTQLHAVCKWCVLSHLLNILLLWLAWKLWPRSGEPEASEPLRPTNRLGLSGVLLIIAVAAICLQRLAVAQMRGMTEQANEYARSFYDDIDLQRYLVLRTAPVDIPIRPDDPVRGHPAAPHTAVVFSDLQCPACRSFANFYESQVMPMAGDRLKLVYKHYPLDPACNPGVSRQLHPQACEAAYAAEAARAAGGGDAFWRAHDFLFHGQDTLPQKPWPALAQALGLEPARLTAQINGAAYRDRILEDAALGRGLGINHTPTVFFDGREMKEWSRAEIWKALVE
jgi:protein-disulfide isomerase/uncharacterized membrane protein